MRKQDNTQTSNLRGRIAGLDIDVQERPSGVAWTIYDADSRRIAGDEKSPDLATACIGVLQALMTLAADAQDTPDTPIPDVQVDAIVGRVLAVLDARGKPT